MSRKHKRGSAGRQYRLVRCNRCLDRRLPELLNKDGICKPCTKDTANRFLRL